ncbi:hypothetical protein COO59_10660 [Mixta theicola]|uniref:MalT-like TPR region domain-containing protein n=1 Tax=Mixta theicola TaxID=1458355 RepID=A0A2K1Q9G2_9GAMM|nr:hypothetical protein COO59_10660 [Mixta theicola]
MSSEQNPSEKAVSQLEMSWLEATKQSQAPLFIWQVPAAGEPLLNALFAMQQHPEGRTLPDLFVTFTTQFDTGYGYSESLSREFIELCEATPEAAHWRGEARLPCYSAARFRDLAEDFTRTFAKDMRYLVLVLQPSDVSDMQALQRWLTHWLSQTSKTVRLLLIETAEYPLWQALEQSHPQQIQRIIDDADVMQVMHQTARQQSDPDPDRLQLRRYLADAMLLLEKGSASQVVSRAELALPVVQRRGWADQETVLYNIMAGAWLKEKNCLNAITQYQQAKRSAIQVPDPLTRGQLMTQSAFGEAGAWFADKQYHEAAKQYREAARQAKAIPHPLFETEAWRMAGFSLLQAGRPTEAMSDYAHAIHAAEAVPYEEREQTSLPLVFQDLLRIQDKKRVSALEACAERWQQEKKRLVLEADAAVSQLQKPETRAVSRIDNHFQLRLEKAFLSIRQAREALIQHGSREFRQVIDLAREKLHPHWNGLPGIAHPFDAPPGEWQSLPAWGKNTAEAAPSLTHSSPDQT